MIAGNKVKLVKTFAEFFQISKTELQSLHVDAGSMMIPVAQK
jgi:hypothetical protein